MHHGRIPFLSIDEDPSIFAASHHPLIVLEKKVHKGRGMDGWVEERERERERESGCEGGRVWRTNQPYDLHLQ
jgi:hypothetical protein